MVAGVLCKKYLILILKECDSIINVQLGPIYMPSIVWSIFSIVNLTIVAATLMPPYT